MRNIVKSIKEERGKDVYLGDLILLDSEDGPYLSYLFSYNDSSEQYFEKIVCRYIIPIEVHADIRHYNDYYVSDEYKIDIDKNISDDEEFILDDKIYSLGNVDDFIKRAEEYISKDDTESKYMKTELEYIKDILKKTRNEEGFVM